MANSYEHLEIWKKALDLASDIYSYTKKFPKDEMFGIISQIRRAVISISSNIAEGSGRSSKKEFSRFIDISIGSLNEVESLIFVSANLEYISKADSENILIKVRNLGSSLGAFKKYLSK